jgi:hypothetical protein
MFGGLLNNPNAMIQISSVVLDEMNRPQSNGQANPLDSILQNLLNPSGRGPSQPNVNTRTINTNTTTTNTINTTNTYTNTINNTTTTTNQTNSISNQNNLNIDILDQYPILRPANEHALNVGNIVNEITGANSNNIPTLPNHSYPRNILIAIGTVLKNLSDNVSRFLPYVNLLANGLERESLITSSEERNKLQELARKITTGLNDISQSCSSLQQTMNGLNFGTGPGMGYTTLLHTTLNSISVINPNETNQSNQLQTTNTSLSTEQQTSTETREIQNNQSNPRNDPLGQVLSQLNQPGGLQNMMSMVGSMLNNPSSGGNIMNMMNSLMGGSNNPNSSNQINNIISSLLNQPNDQTEESEEIEELVFANIVLNFNIDIRQE